MKRILMILAMVMGLVVGNTTTVWGQLEKYFKMSCAELEKKGNAGDVNAQHVLGIQYQLGEDGWEKDVVKAFKWFEKAAKQGDLHSQSYIGYAYSSGIGVEKNINKAIEWYSKAAERGDASAQRSLGDIYLQADDVPQDCLKAIEWYKKAANNLSDSLSANMAAFDLGSCYEWGKCVTKDISEAKIWYKISADLGNSYSKQHLEELEDPKLKKKNEEEKNKREIEELTQKANNGDDNAQCDLAFYYSNGEKGLKKNYKKSNEWYEKAAKQGNCRAQRSLGVAYYEGLGVKQDYTKAFEWYEKAAKQGDLLAYQFLGTCYLEGKGVASDCKKAIELYEKYMEQKEDYFIAYKLGEIYRYGANGCIPINLVEAKKWFNKSANLGWDMANVQIEDIEDIESGKKEMYIPNPTENNGSYTENRGKNPKVKKQRDGHVMKMIATILEGASNGLNDFTANYYGYPNTYTAPTYTTPTYTTPTYTTPTYTTPSYTTPSYTNNSTSGYTNNYNNGSNNTNQSNTMSDQASFDKANELYKSGNYSEAMGYFIPQANKGDAYAQYNIGQCYRELQNYSSAFEWYQKAANQGLAEAQNYLGVMYAAGKGVAQNYNQAFEWYQKAANQGHAAAERELAWCYLGGKGVAQNYNQAFEWYQKAANQGDAHAQFCMGMFYQYGWGNIKEDKTKATEWYQKAANKGHQKAKSFLDNLRNK